ncbi:hypothetical protein P7C70_g1897, partial [Phenoliferia sp. Uapishka_3]
MTATESTSIAFQIQPRDAPPQLSRGAGLAKVRSTSEGVKVLGSPTDSSGVRWDEVESLTSEYLIHAEEQDSERWKISYRRGAARKQRGDLEGAATDFRASLNAGAGRSVARELSELEQHDSSDSSSFEDGPSTAATSYASLKIRKPFLFRISESTLGHLGAFATEHLPLGTVIIAETPLVTTPSLKSVPMRLAALSAVEREVYDNLCNSFPTSGATARSTELGIWETNAFELASPEGATAIYPICARFNHSCTPNATSSFHPSSGTIRIHIIATGGVHPGEEIMTSYLSPKDFLGSPTQSRRRNLEMGWNFQCGCVTCKKAQTVEGKESDQRRLRIAALRGCLPRLKPAEGEAKDLLVKVGRAMRLVKDEGLETLWDSLATEGAKICAFHGDLESSGR